MAQASASNRPRILFFFIAPVPFILWICILQRLSKAVHSVFRLLLLHNFRSVVDVRGYDWLFSEEKSFLPGFGYSNSGQKQRFQNFCPHSTEKTRQAHEISATSTYTIIVFGETIVKSYVKNNRTKMMWSPAPAAPFGRRTPFSRGHTSGALPWTVPPPAKSSGTARSWNG